MEKLVSIIIPFYQENLRQLKMVLTSISVQVGIDFKQVEVVLVSDGGIEVNPHRDLPEFDQFEITVCRNLTNYGAGVARQVGMEEAGGHYYMFVDADDRLYSVCALASFFEVVKKHGDRDVIIGKYVEQVLTNSGEFEYRDHDQRDWTSPVVKWFNRDFINQIGLSWHAELRVFEDTYFVGLACELADQIYYLSDQVYIWLWNDHSTMRVAGGQQVTSQLAMWAKMNHAYLDVIARQKPANLLNDFSDYVVDIFLRSQKYVPADPGAFAEEHRLLMKDYARLWPTIRPKMRQAISTMIYQVEDYNDCGLRGLRTFVKRQDELSC